MSETVGAVYSLSIKFLRLFKKFMISDYYLFPKWVCADKVFSYFEEINKFAPFTIYATGIKSTEEGDNYQDTIIGLIKYIDVGFSKHAALRAGVI